MAVAPGSFNAVRQALMRLETRDSGRGGGRFSRGSLEYREARRVRGGHPRPPDVQHAPRDQADHAEHPGRSFCQQPQPPAVARDLRYRTDGSSRFHPTEPLGARARRPVLNPASRRHSPVIRRWRARTGGPESARPRRALQMASPPLPRTDGGPPEYRTYPGSSYRSSRG